MPELVVELFDTWYEKAGITDEDLIQAVENKKLDKETILNFNLTDVARGAYYNTYLASVIKKYLGFDPLPLKTETNDCEPIRLYPHQEEGITFMKKREEMSPNETEGIQGGIIKMKMGMGKTLLGISYSLLRKGKNPTLIVASKTVMDEWKRSGFEKFVQPEIRVLYFHRAYIGKEINTLTREDLLTYDFVVTTYDVVSTGCKGTEYEKQVEIIEEENPLLMGKVVEIRLRTLRDLETATHRPGPKALFCTPFHRVICDESQRFANPKTKTYKYILGLYGKYKWCLTGTPIRNYDTDIWAQFRFLGYNKIARPKQWTKTKNKGTVIFKSILNVNYEDTHIQLPELVEEKKHIEFNKKERQIYNAVHERLRYLYKAMMRDSSNMEFSALLAYLTRLRQICVAPYLICDESKRGDKPTPIASHFEPEELEWLKNGDGEAGIGSTRIQEVVSIIKSLPKKDKMLVFSTFTSALDLCVKAVKKYLPKTKYLQLDGDTLQKDRGYILSTFANNPKAKVLFITYKVGSEGLNITCANHVILLEPWWTPVVEDQAVARCWRNGQTKKVQVHSIRVKDTIEEHIDSICEEKKRLIKKYISGSSKGMGGAGIDKYTLGRIIGVH